MPGLGNFAVGGLPSPMAGVQMNPWGDLLQSIVTKPQRDADKAKLAAQQKAQGDAAAQRLLAIQQQNPKVAGDKGWQSAVIQAQKMRGLPVPDFTQLMAAQTQGAPQGALAAGAPGDAVTGSRPQQGQPVQPQMQQPAAQGQPAAQPQQGQPQGPGANPQATAAASQAAVQKIGQLLPYRQNPVAQKQIQAILQQYGSIIPPQAKQQIAAALQQPAGAQPQAQGPRQPNSIPNLAAGNAVGAPPTGGGPALQGSMAAPGSAQAGAAPPSNAAPQAGAQMGAAPAQQPQAGAGYGASILNTPQTPMTAAQAFADPSIAKILNEATSEGKRGLNAALGLNLPEEYLKLGPQYGQMERAQASNEVYMSLNNMANGTGMNAQTFMSWAQHNQPKLEAAGIDIQGVMSMEPRVMEQLSATATAKINEMASTGLLKKDQAQVMLKELPAKLDNMSSLDDLRKFQERYYGVRADTLPQQVQSQIAYRSKMADAAFQNAQTHVAALDQKIKEFSNGGGSLKSLTAARSYVQALEGDARAADGEYQAMFRTAQSYMNNNFTKVLPDDMLKSLNDYKQKADLARQLADQYKSKLVELGPQAMSAAGLQGVNKTKNTGGGSALGRAPGGLKPGKYIVHGQQVEVRSDGNYYSAP